MSTIFLWKKILFSAFFIAVFGFLLVWQPNKAQATLESCTSVVTPHSVTTSIQQNFTFTLTNTGSNPILFFKVTSPSDAFSIQGKDATGWSATHDSTFVQFWGGSIAAGEAFDFTVSIKAGATEAAAANWVVVANDALSSEGTTTCTGDTSIAITGVADVIGPVLSELVTVSGINVSSATVGWTTDELSTSVVSYGTTDALGSTASDGTLTLSHSVGLSSLSAGTTYYFNVSSTDASGNTTESSQGTFTTTAEEILTVTEAAETTVVTTITVTPTPTPIPTPPPVDRTPPQVVVETDLSEPFEVAPLIKGRAVDNKFVMSVEYSTDGGSNWIPVDIIESVGASKTNFEFAPYLNEDGNYPIQVRAKDKRGNTGKSREVILVIDRLPPLVGGNLISLGPQPLMPNANGTVVALAGLEQKITLSAVGGPIAIDLFVGEKTIPLEYSAETSLWFGYLDLDKVGTYTLSTKAVDGAENETTRDLNTVKVISAGRVFNKKTGEVVTKGKISIHIKDSQTNVWNLWDAKAFSQENPQPLDGDGAYQFFLPPGTYYLQIESAGFQTLKSNIFVLDESRPINSDFNLEDGRVIKLGPIKIPLPVFLQKTLEINLSLPVIDEGVVEESSLLDQPAPAFSLENGSEQFQLSSLRGQTSIVSFISTWSPPAVEQISVINKLVEEKLKPIVMISTQETASKVAIFRQRGDYKTPIWVDPDGELVEKYRLTTLPTHLVLDKRGNVIKVITQVLNEEELLKLLF